MTDVEQAVPVIAVTVGYLLKRTAQTITLAQTRSDDSDQWGGVWVIPAGWVTKVRKLK